MSWKIGLYIDSTIAEISAVPRFQASGQAASQKYHKRWYLPKQSLAEGLKEFFQNTEIKDLSTKPTVNVSTGYSTSLLEKRAGDPPALLVTLGFENWPFLRHPLQSTHFSVNAQRTQPLLSHDLVFGVSERIDHTGKVQKPLETSEIDFLISKLQFSEVKSVAIGFLHSQKNPTHEKQVAELLTQAGFHVVCSHQAPQTTNEVARWWRTFLGTYAQSAYTEFMNTVTTTLTGLEYPSSNTLGEDPVVSSLTDIERALVASRPEADTIFYAGLDRWTLISKNEKQHVAEFDFGPVYLESPRFAHTRLQPTQEVAIGAWGGLDVTPIRVGLDPGPMLFGRSLRPTILDILSLSDKGQEYIPTPLVKPEAKIRETLKAMARSAKIDVDEALKDVESLVRDSLLARLIDFKGDSSCVIVGAMAPRLHQLLGMKDLILPTDCTYAVSEAIATREAVI